MKALSRPRLACLGALMLAGAAATLPAAAQGAATTASVTLQSGSLAFVDVTPATTLNFPATTLNGTNQSVNATLVFDVADATGSGAGWNVSATSTPFTSGSHSLPDDATTIRSAPSIVCDLLPIGCTLASTLIGYPYTLPAAGVPPAATPIFDAAAGTGLGDQSFTTTWTLEIPANAIASATPYTSTWTFSLGSGP
ncbi:MAG: hypothetical protein ABR947_12380 [Solirubrobacteraceae bacterium]